MQPRERLNPKEIEVATMVWKGQTNRDIANEIDNRNAIALARTDAQLIFQHGILLKN